MMRGDSLSVETPGRDYWREQIACQAACPVGTDARGYVQAIARGDFAQAYLIARGPNPLASLCARICGAPCEAACRRGTIDAPVSIRALKRFAWERYVEQNGRDAGRLLEQLMDQQGRLDCQGEEDITAFANWIRNAETSGAFQPAAPDAERVAIIGSGPAGLAAAHDLAVMGFRPTVFELEQVPAGMLYTGVPEYRLPRDVIEAEIEVIKSLGVEFRCSVEVGKDVPFSTLRADFEAVVIAVGLKRSRKLPLPGIDAKGVLGAVEFLREVALHRTVALGESVVVIGGGNVAYDAARTAVRQSGFDASRSALRVPGVCQVTLCSLESLDDMPADDVEIREGDEEGVVRIHSVGPREILVDDSGRVRGVRFVQALSVFDADGRFDPQFDESVVTEVEADTVVLAIGQQADLAFIDTPKDGVDVNERGQLQVDGETLETSAPGVFAAGEVAYGAKLMIHAVASGKAVARRVFRFLRGRDIRQEEVELHFAIEPYHREPGYEKQPRVQTLALPPASRVSSMLDEVEQVFDVDSARLEASRCLDCGVNTIFDSARCILCGGCADVCPEQCLDIVSASRLRGNAEFDRLLSVHLDGVSPERAGAIIKDEERCIRCGLCAERCPVGAITMERYTFARTWCEQPLPEGASA